MEALIALLVVYLVVVLVILPIWALVKILGHDGDVEVLQGRMRSQDDEIRKLNVALRDLSAVVLSRSAPQAGAADQKHENLPPTFSRGMMDALFSAP